MQIEDPEDAYICNILDGHASFPLRQNDCA
jgi:hypothetical protein